MVKWRSNSGSARVAERIDKLECDVRVEVERDVRVEVECDVRVEVGDGGEGVMVVEADLGGCGSLVANCPCDRATATTCCQYCELR